MNLSIGIVGLPNVGKSTLFNALLKKQASFVETMASQAGLAKTANYPFTTIEPNVGVVPVPDSRLAQLAQMIKESENLPQLPPLVSATVEFVDIAGLIAGAKVPIVLPSRADPAETKRMSLVAAAYLKKR